MCFLSRISETFPLGSISNPIPPLGYAREFRLTLGAEDMMSFFRMPLWIIVFLTIVPALGNAQEAPPATIDWTGFYIGGSVGGAWDHLTFSGFVPPGSNINGTAIALEQATDNGRSSMSGALAGVQGGYNFQSGGLVLGVETSFSWLDGNDTRDSGNKNVGGIVGRTIDNTSTDWLFTAGPRIGVADGIGMLYATGGVAVLRQSFDHKQAWSFSDGCPANLGPLELCHSGSDSNTRTTWFAGLGAQFAIADGWSLRGEGLFVPGDDITITTQNTGFSGQPIIANANFDHLFIFRAGLNYGF